jgi:hypothetical protein
VQRAQETDLRRELGQFVGRQIKNAQVVVSSETTRKFPAHIMRVHLQDNKNKKQNKSLELVGRKVELFFRANMSEDKSFSQFSQQQQTFQVCKLDDFLRQHFQLVCKQVEPGFLFFKQRTKEPNESEFYR